MQKNGKSSVNGKDADGKNMEFIIKCLLALFFLLFVSFCLFFFNFFMGVVVGWMGAAKQYYIKVSNLN